MTVEAGCVLQTIQERAQAAGRLFPLSLGAEGSCQIGGNIATNAGGVQVLRYGNTRDLVLGLEVVLADGQVLDLLRGLRKDNTGYDLKQHFIGSEGTLGIITAATIKLYPAPACTSIAFAGVPSVSHAIELLHAMRAAMGERFAAFELMSRATVDMVMRYFPETPKALQTASPWYILMEAADGGEATALDAAMEAALGGAIEAGLIEDVALAASSLQAQALWQMRENVAEAQQRDGANIKHDIAVPISMISAFVDEVLPILEQAYPGSRPVVFGHVGDGNLHFNLSAPAGWPIADWQAQTDAVNTLVHDVVTRYRGSISAEHGIGQLKRHELEIYKTPLELAVMWRIKDALDPKGIMNPGKVLPAKLRA
jgi:FAD/FMN-containing dehydrogenase